MLKLEQDADGRTGFEQRVRNVFGAGGKVSQDLAQQVGIWAGAHYAILRPPQFGRGHRL